MRLPLLLIALTAAAPPSCGSDAPHPGDAGCDGVAQSRCKWNPDSGTYDRDCVFVAGCLPAPAPDGGTCLTGYYSNDPRDAACRD